MRALVIEDDPDLREQISKFLTAEGFAVDAAADGTNGAYMAEEYPADVAVIDLGLPGMSGIDLIRQVRKSGRKYPILILTARDGWQSKVEGLEAGADDYLVKPFHKEELLARVRALVRRVGGWAQAQLQSGPYIVDTSARSVMVDGKPAELTSYEFRVLEYLLTNAGKVISKSELTEHLYTESEERDSNVIEVFIRRLRAKLDPDSHYNPITTLRGSGYRWGSAARLKAVVAAKPRVSSLRARLLIATAVVLLAFVGLGGLALEKAFESALLQSQQDKLEGLIYALLAAASTTPDGELTITLDAVPDRRLREPLSGLQAALFNERGKLVWSSARLLDVQPPPPLTVGEWHFERLRKPDVFRLSFGLRWIDTDDNKPRLFTVTVIDDTSSFESQERVFRRTLWLWLAATVIGLTVLLLLILRWSLAPLRQLGSELQRVESGAQGEILGSYPDELKPLTRDLNAMIVSERSQQTRYRNALGDLAHTLKTPLAVLRGLSSEPDIPSAQRQQLDEQLGRMLHIVDHQLQRAAAAGSRTLTEPVPLKPLADKLMQALAKVYAARAIQFDNRLDASLRLRADQGDLYELLGNLLDNAAKYGHRRVRLSGQLDGKQCCLDFEDDGPGFPDEPEKLLERGVRADTRQSGQGIGLASVHEIVHAYGGQLLLQASTLGGARVRVLLPIR